MKPNIKENILKLYKRDKTIADNYNWLLFSYWSNYDKLDVEKYVNHRNVYYILENNISSLTSSESITRAFRKLVEDNEIKLDETIKSLREQEEEDYRKEYGKK